MQAALEEASLEFQQAFANEFARQSLETLSASSCQFRLAEVRGVDALQRLLVFMLEELTPHAMEVAVHVYGCRVLQRLIEHCSKEPQLASLVESVLSTVQILRNFSRILLEAP